MIKQKLIDILGELKKVIKVTLSGIYKTNPDEDKKINEITPLWCHRCNGTGQVTERRRVEEHLPSRFGIQSYISASVICPTCKGAGRIRYSEASN